MRAMSIDPSDPIVTRTTIRHADDQATSKSSVACDPEARFTPMMIRGRLPMLSSENSSFTGRCLPILDRDPSFQATTEDERIGVTEARIESAVA